jgi:hypothetical protein
MTVRDSQGRDTRIHGLVLNESNPGPTLRELLRQWSEAGLEAPGDLAERTRMVLEAVGPDGGPPRCSRIDPTLGSQCRLFRGHDGQHGDGLGVVWDE